MGTKQNPGKFDCYSRAEPDEPVFVLLGRDPVAHILVEDWASLRERLGKTEPKVIEEARQCALSMFDWASNKGKVEQQDAAERLRRESVQDWRRQGAEREAQKSRELYEKVLKLQNLCHRAADTIAEQVSINVADGGLRGRQELDDLVRELRGA